MCCRCPGKRLFPSGSFRRVGKTRSWAENPPSVWCLALSCQAEWSGHLELLSCGRPVGRGSPGALHSAVKWVRGYSLLRLVPQFSFHSVNREIWPAGIWDSVWESERARKGESACFRVGKSFFGGGDDIRNCVAIWSKLSTLPLLY